MNLRDQLSGLGWLAISIFVCAESMSIGVGTFRSPGSGFFLFLSGVGLGMLALTLVAKEILKKKGDENITNLWKGVKWSKVIFVLASLFIYAILLPILGYVIMTFLLMTFLFGIGVTERPRLWVLGVSALFAALLSYIVFCVWLDVQLPKGIFGF